MTAIQPPDIAPAVDLDEELVVDCDAHASYASSRKESEVFRIRDVPATSMFQLFERRIAESEYCHVYTTLLILRSLPTGSSISTEHTNVESASLSRRFRGIFRHFGRKKAPRAKSIIPETTPPPAPPTDILSAHRKIRELVVHDRFSEEGEFLFAQSFKPQQKKRPKSRLSISSVPEPQVMPQLFSDSALDYSLESIVEQVYDMDYRILISASLDDIFRLLIHPDADMIYFDFTRDFLLCYPYFTDDFVFWDQLSNAFVRWDKIFREHLDELRQQGSLRKFLGRATRRKTEPTIFVEESFRSLGKEDSIEILVRILELIHTWLVQFLSNDNDAYFTLHGKILIFIEDNLRSHPAESLRSWFDVFSSILLDPPGSRKETEWETFSEKTGLSFLDIDPQVIFEQLTLKEVYLFKAARPMDLMYKSKGKLQRAPKLQRLISHFNHVSYWVATEICMTASLYERVRVLKRFIKIARLCYEWKNYNTCLQIVAALSMTCVQRLKNTWKNLPSKYNQSWLELSTLFSSAQNYSTYRNEILSKMEDDVEISNGGISFIGIHLSDLIHVEEGPNGKDYVNGNVNWTKMRLAAAVYKKFIALQHATNFPFDIDSWTQNFLENDTIILDEDKLWKASRICEPPDFVKPSGIPTDFMYHLSLNGGPSSAAEDMRSEEVKPPPRTIYQSHVPVKDDTDRQSLASYETCLEATSKVEKDSKLTDIARHDSRNITIAENIVSELVDGIMSTQSESNTDVQTLVTKQDRRSQITVFSCRSSEKDDSDYVGAEYANSAHESELTKKAPCQLIQKDDGDDGGAEYANSAHESELVEEVPGQFIQKADGDEVTADHVSSLELQKEDLCQLQKSDSVGTEHINSIINRELSTEENEDDARVSECDESHVYQTEDEACLSESTETIESSKSQHRGSKASIGLQTDKKLKRRRKKLYASIIQNGLVKHIVDHFHKVKSGSDTESSSIYNYNDDELEEDDGGNELTPPISEAPSPTAIVPQKSGEEVVFTKFPRLSFDPSFGEFIEEIISKHSDNKDCSSTNE